MPSPFEEYVSRAEASLFALREENRRLRDALRGIEQKFPKSDAAWLARAALAATEDTDGK